MSIRRGRKLARASKPSSWEVDAGAKEFKAILSHVVGQRSVILSYETLSQKQKKKKKEK